MDNKRKFLIHNRKNLCEHGGLHSMIARQKIYPSQGIQFYERNIYKKWESKSVLEFNSSKEIPKFTNHGIS